MKGKIFVLLVCIAMLVGVLSGCTETKVEANKLPEASFTYEPMTEIYVGTEISFTDASTDEDGTIASWAWDFGDDETSTAKNPTHAYSGDVGTYTVTLIVTDNDGNASEPYTMDIEVTYVPPTADFTYEPMVNITVNMTIVFADDSIEGDANITTLFWDFGDGMNSTEQDPAEHVYTIADTYTVTLTVTDGNGESDTESKDIIVAEEI